MLVLLLPALAVLSHGETPGTIPKVIYGEDNRLDVYADPDERHQQWARATCALVDKTSLRLEQDGSYTLLTIPYYYPGTSFPACEDEPFADQPTGCECSGSAVSADLVATAGHCYDSTDLNTVRFVFGFVMADADTPVVNFPADRVYAGVEVVGRAYTSRAADWALVRLDRPVSFEGFAPLTLRREGSIAEGEAVGVIGHPSGLPMKTAFGDTTVVRDITPTTHFVANLDTYGGNSGSPVFNAVTGLMEGVLVRGDADFAIDGGCFRSLVNPDDGGRGEDVTRSTLFAYLVPADTSHQGSIAFLETVLACAGGGNLVLTDPDLAGQGTAPVAVVTEEGDEETFLLEETAADSGVFEGAFTTVLAVADPGDGVVEVSVGDTVTARYADANYGGGEPLVVTASIGVDCFPPGIALVAASNVTTSTARITFTTDETATGVVRYGLDCEAANLSAESALGTSHGVGLAGLQDGVTYYYRVEATDVAGNTAEKDNTGLCYQFTTPERTDYRTEVFDASGPDLNGVELVFQPGDTPTGYRACARTSAGPLAVTGEATALVLGDDDSARVELPEGSFFPWFGVAYGDLHVCGNGFISFGTVDTSFTPAATTHFAASRLSMLLRDMNPVARGTITAYVAEDHVTVTFEDIPNFDPNGTYVDTPGNTFQARLYYDGTVRLVYLDVAAGEAVAGLSPGGGVPADFESSDLGAASDCADFVGDVDGDGLPTGWELAWGLDDFDGTGDMGPEGDPDGDGLSNARELELGTHPADTDSDGDGMRDDVEVALGLDPAVGTGDDGGLGDPDGDGVGNAMELTVGTHPLHWDSDRDGRSDGAELATYTATGVGEPHHADTDGDGRISLSELLRVVQFARSTGYGCLDGTEDGYAPDGETADCLVHHADYAPEDYVISTTELLRIVQFYHAGGYGRDMFSEDSFSVGP